MSRQAYDLASPLPPYPLDLSVLLAQDGEIPHQKEAAHQITTDIATGSNEPLTRVRLALAHWNAYLTTRDEQHQRAFIAHAAWLAEHQVPLAGDAGGWLVSSPRESLLAPASSLSASMQGSGISVLLRAYLLTGDAFFLSPAQHAIGSFERDILDGGISSLVGEGGLFFEEKAVYPAAHALRGFILGLFGLYEYLDFTGDAHIASLVQRSHATLHTLLHEFDTGYWSRQDLLKKGLSSPALHSEHILLLRACASHSGCAECLSVAQRWARYKEGFRFSLWYWFHSRLERVRRVVSNSLRRLLFPTTRAGTPRVVQRVCVPITGFPLTGGMRGVLAGVARVMAGEWQMEHLVRHKGPQAGEYIIDEFGFKHATPWQFPNVWFYVFTGWKKLLSLLRHSRYDFILSQDGLHTGAFAALAAKMAGMRVVCMDHGSVTILYSKAYRAERLKAIAARPGLSRLLSRLRYLCFWPSLRLFAWVATRLTDQFLIAGDDVEEIYRQRFGVHPSRIVRYPYVIDVGRYRLPDQATKEQMRAQKQIPRDGILIAMVNRLAPEKGLDIAIKGISLGIARLSPELQARVRVIIAGDGPLRSQVEADIQKYQLDGVCTLWGETNPDDVIGLLCISDFFLYTGTRGTNYSMSIIEAMAAGCAVIASVEPIAHARLLAEGRGFPIPPQDADAVGTALAQAIHDMEEAHMRGWRAREYVTAYHSAAELRRCLWRATYWSENTH